MAKVCLLAVATALAAPAAGEEVALSPLPRALRFFAAGDFGGAADSVADNAWTSYQWKLDVAAQMARYAEAFSPRFLLGLGDNFYENGLTGADDPAWKEQWEDVYASPHLREVPWLMTLGNHDYRGGHPEAQIERTEAFPEGRWQMPSKAYARVFSTCDDASAPAGGRVMGRRRAGSDDLFSASTPVEGVGGGVVDVEEGEVEVEGVSGVHGGGRQEAAGAAEEEEGCVSVEILSVDTNAISYTMDPETAGSCQWAHPTPGCSPVFEAEGARIAEWLRGGLEASVADWKVVAGHFPIFSAGQHGSLEETAILREAILSPMRAYKADVYASGHDHIAQHATDRGWPGGPDHVIVGTSGPKVLAGPWHPEFGDQAGFDMRYASLEHAFAIFEATETVLRISFIASDGSLAYSFTRPRTHVRGPRSAPQALLQPEGEEEVEGGGPRRQRRRRLRGGSTL